MKGDITRETFQRQKHYTGVRMQQGRVLLDSEWNEQVDIGRYFDETANVDVIGVAGASRISGGFLLVAVPGNDLIIKPGRMWIDGILCECDSPLWSPALKSGANTVQLAAWPADASRLAANMWIELSDGVSSEYRPIMSTDPSTRTIALNFFIGLGAVTQIRPVYSYATQPHDPFPDHVTIGGSGFRTINLRGTFIAYLDVWIRHLTAVEDDSMREIALGGPDTTTRTQTIWQVRLDDSKTDCADVKSPQHTSRMLARTSPVAPPDNPCSVPATAGYRGLANQLYRVEVHKPTGAPGGPTFKWSRDNGAFVFGVEAPIPGQTNQLRLHSLGRDDHFGLHANDWVELIDETLELQGKPGIIAKLSVTPEQHNRIITFDATTLPVNTDFNVPAQSPIDLTRNPRVRLWSYDIAEPHAERAITTATPIPLESGIEIEFSGTNFATGEYWLIPARTAINEETGKIEWPQFGGAAVPLPPRGINHHLAPLAHVDATNHPWQMIDCRPLFSPLAAPDFVYLSGDGQEVMPNLVTKASVPLPFDLKVGVVNGGPIANAMVRFKIVSGGGTVTGGVTQLDVPTGADGVASVKWTVSATVPHQMCSATLLKANGYDPVNLPPIEFNASLSIASEVAYDPANCQELQARGATNVQKALDAFCDILDDPKLYFVGGDGQEALRGSGLVSLPAKIEVGVANGIRPVAGATVRFTPSDGGTIDGAGGFKDVNTGSDGTAAVDWALNSAGPESQSATARLMVNNTPVGLPVIFHASFREGGGVCTIELHPGPNWELPLRNLKPGQSAEICFAVGDFFLDQPVAISGAGNLKLTGGGTGTRITIVKSEFALLFDGCGDVIVRDLYAEAQHSPQQHVPPLNGVLTFNNCASVTLESLHVRCASALWRGGTCATIKSTASTANPNATPPKAAPALALPTVRVTGCDFAIGNEQIGLLVVNPFIARIEDNVFTSTWESIQMSQILNDPRARVPYRRLLISHIWVGRTARRDSKLARPNFKGQVGRQDVEVSFRTQQSLISDWSKFLQGDPPSPRPSRVIHYLEDFARSILTNPPARAPYPAFQTFMSDLPQQVQARPAAGIVVGGQFVGAVQILGNVVIGAAEGIRAGASEVGKPKGRGGVAIARLEVSRNMVQMLKDVSRRAHHGIRIGSCSSLIVEKNSVVGFTADAEAEPPVGISVTGKSFGLMVGVQANHMENCNLIVLPQSSRVGPIGLVQWFATDNMTEHGTNTIGPNVRQNPPNVFIP